MITCPHCGEDISAIIEEELRKLRSAAGSVRTAKKTNAQRANMAKLNSSYTPEKRAAAAQKRLETMRRKKEQENAQ